MRITSWNIQHGIAYRGADFLGSPIADLPSNLSHFDHEIDSALYLFQEVDCRLERSSDINQPRALAEAVGAVDFRFAPTVIGEPSLKSVMPDSARRTLLRDECDAFGGYGNLIVSKLPVKKWIRKDLGKAPLGAPLLIGMGAGQRLIVAPDELRTAIAAILHNGWIVINTHLSFVPGFNIRQIRTLVRWANELEHEFDSRVVIAGDFNLPGRLVRTVTRWHSPEKGATFPQWNPKIEFDHFLLNPDMRHHAQVNARVEVPQIYGDHLPITLDSE